MGEAPAGRVPAAKGQLTVASWMPLLLQKAEAARSRTQSHRLSTESFSVPALVSGAEAVSQAAVPITTGSGAPPHSVYNLPALKATRMP